jgi:hypothetical protein
MLKKWDLNKEAGSLEMLITAISTDLMNEKTSDSQAKEKIVKEMEEALCELRQARGMTKFLLYAIENHNRLSRRVKRSTNH